MTYAFSCLGTLPFCILFHELEVDSQVNYVSIFSLTTYTSVCTVSCQLGGSKISGPACHSLSIVTNFSPLPCSQEKKILIAGYITSRQHLLRTLCKHILHMVTLLVWVTVFEK